MGESKKQKFMGLNGLLALLMVFVLLLPIGSAYYSDFHKRAIIFSASDADLKAPNYVHGVEIPSKTNLEALLGAPTEVYDESDNDSFIFKTGVNEIAYFNSGTAVANDTVVTGLNYSKMTAGAGVITVGFSMALTSHNITNFDFIEIITDHLEDSFTDLSLEGISATSAFGFAFTETANGTWVVPLDLSVKTIILSQPDADIYIWFAGADETETAWIFSTTYYELADTVWSWDDFQLYAMAIMGAVVIMGIAIAFNTDTFDLKIDKNRKDRR